MDSSKMALAEKLVEMYPDITKHNLELGLDFDTQKDAWVISLKKDTHELKTFLDKKDADECLNGIKCIYLGVQIGQFVQHFEEDEGTRS